MIEKFKDSKLTGDIQIDLGEKGVWAEKKLTIVKAIINVCNSYAKSGYNMTLRQLYYQLVAKDLIPNHDKVYKKLSKVKDDVVYGGYVDWDVFEDRGRVPHVPYYEDGVAEALEKTVDYYRLERQRGQEVHVEVWTEKDAISNILKRVTQKMGVTLVVNKGYTSSTAMYTAYERFLERVEDGQKVKILYFGDHDPSGLDMVRDIDDRIMYMFTRGKRLDSIIQDWWERNGHTYYDIAQFEDYADLPELFDKKPESEKVYVKFERGKRHMYFYNNDLFEIKQIGLTMAQIKQFNPPPNPAKITDPRAQDYVRKYGQVSWEVDALKPSVMENIVRAHIEITIDMSQYKSVLEKEQEDKAQIREIVNNLNN